MMCISYVQMYVHPKRICGVSPSCIYVEYTLLALLYFPRNEGWMRSGRVPRLLTTCHTATMPDWHTLQSVKRRKLATSAERLLEHLGRGDQVGHATVKDHSTEKSSQATDWAPVNSGSPAGDLLRGTANRRKRPASLTKEVSPPPLRRLTRALSSSLATPPPFLFSHSRAAPPSCSSKPQPVEIDLTTSPPRGGDGDQALLNPPNRFIPFRLTHISALPTNHTVTLSSLLTPPKPCSMLTTLWCFNYMHSLPFLTSQLHQTTDLSTLRIHLVHGSWRRDDPQHLRLDQERLEHPYPGNVRLVPAYLPEPFGTHHSKILVLFCVRGDGSHEMVRVVVHTANMIPFDWGNMTQGVWDSGWMPLLLPSKSESPIGAEFKHSLLRYFKAYTSSRTGELTAELPKYDFSSIHAAFLGSVPGKYKLSDCHFGWPGLKRILRNVHIPTASMIEPATVVAQISSIATLAPGAKDTWLSPVFLNALATAAPSNHPLKKPNFAIVFPTPDEVRKSLNGYDSGGSIHLKAVTPIQLKQIDYLRPYFYRWAASLAPTPSRSLISKSAANQIPPLRLSARAIAAPHIKSYVRFTDSSCTSISWALLTSANLSTQAWGSAPLAPSGSSSKNKSGIRQSGRLVIAEPDNERDADEREVKISSYEAGIIVYPELFCQGGTTGVTLKPLSDREELVFEQELGGGRQDEVQREGGHSRGILEGKNNQILVGIRMPYDLPLVKYSPSEMPWSPGRSYAEQDCLGKRWVV